jgi:hypothetical protein
MLKFQPFKRIKFPMLKFQSFKPKKFYQLKFQPINSRIFSLLSNIRKITQKNDQKFYLTLPNYSKKFQNSRNRTPSQMASVTLNQQPKTANNNAKKFLSCLQDSTTTKTKKPEIFSLVRKPGVPLRIFSCFL